MRNPSFDCNIFRMSLATSRSKAESGKAWTQSCASLIVMSDTSAIERPPTRMANACGRKRVPRHASHEKGLRYRLSMTRTWSLYRLPSRYLKKAWMPSTLAFPSHRKVRSSDVSFSYGLVMSQPWRLKPSSICLCHHSADGLVQGSIVPAARLLALSGTIRSSSYRRLLPNPLQVGHAPSGWLNEKRAGFGISKMRPQD